jgi:hypothetical protein
MAKQNQDVEKLVKQIRDFQTELDTIKKGLSSTLGDQSSVISGINSELNKTISAFKKIRNAQNLTLDKQTKQLKETKSLADVYKQIPDALSGFKSTMMDTLSISEKLTASAKAASGAKKAELTAFASTYNQTLSLATELSSLNKEDTLERSIQNNEIEKSLNLLQTQADAYALINGKENETFQNLQKQIEALKNIVLEANSIANTSKEIKDIYGEVYGDLNNLNTQFKKIAATVEVFFSSFKNAAGMSLIFIGGLVDGFNELSKSVGGTVGQMFQLKSQSFLVSKLLGDDAAKGVTTLAEKLGNANDVTLGMSLGVGALSSRLGVSGDEAATLANMFGNLSNESTEVAFNTMEAASNLASANGVAPAGVMKDIAENTETFALYAKDGGANIAQAAVQARRLGVDLGTAAKISDNLLDYQTSVQSEMEASVLLGRNLNLNKARELAYADDIEGAMMAAIDAAGGINEYNKMDVYQKRAVAEAIGVSNTELKQMVANQEKALTPAGKLEGEFNSITATARELGATFLGTGVKGIGGMLIGMKDFKTQVSDAREGFSFLKDTVKGVGGLLTGKGFQGFGGLTDTKEIKTIKSLGKSGSIKPTTPSGGGKEAQTAAGQKQLAGGFTTMGKPGVGMGILNTALAGPALLLLAIGTPGMMAVGSFGVTAGSGLNALSVGMMAFSKVPILAAGVLAATGAAFAVMSVGSLGLAAIALGGVPAAEGLKALTLALTQMGAAALTGVPFAGIGLLAAFGFALMPLTKALSSLAPLVISIGQAISLVFTTMANAFVMMEKSLPNLVQNFLPLLAMIAPIFLLSTAIMALSVSLLALGAASVVAMPALAVMGFAAGAGLGVANSAMVGEGGGDSGLLAEMQGLRSDIKQLAVVVNLDNRQIYRGHVQNIKNNSQG